MRLRKKVILTSLAAMLVVGPLLSSPAYATVDQGIYNSSSTIKNATDSNFNWLNEQNNKAAKNKNKSARIRRRRRRRRNRGRFLRFKGLSFVYDANGQYVVQNQRILYFSRNDKVALASRRPVTINGQRYFCIGTNQYVLANTARRVRK